jgi:hypothetical protein
VARAEAPAHRPAGRGGHLGGDIGFGIPFGSDLPVFDPGREGLRHADQLAAGDFGAILALVPALLTVPTRSARSVISAKNLARLVAVVAVTAGVLGAATLLPDHKEIYFALFLVIIGVYQTQGNDWGRAAVALVVIGILVGVRMGGLAMSHGGAPENRLVLAVFVVGLTLLGLELEVRSQQKDLPLAFIILLLGVLAGARLYSRLDVLVHERVQNRVSERVGVTTADLIDRLNDCVDAVRPAQFLLSTGAGVTAAQWAEFIDDLHLERRYPGMRAIGVVYPVRSTEWETFVAKTKAAQSPVVGLQSSPAHRSRYRLQPETVHYVVTLLHAAHPIAQGAPTGVDMASDPARKEAAEQARDTGQPVLTRNLRLLDANGTRIPGHVIFYPIYQRGENRQRGGTSRGVGLLGGRPGLA